MQKIAVITGASRGLGLVIATEFAAHGWTTIGTGRSSQPPNLPAGIEYTQFDAGDAAASEQFWQSLRHRHMEAEVVLVNNAGAYVSGGLTKTSPADYEGQMRSSYFTSVYMTRSMALAYDKAKVFNVISTSALHPHAANPAYGAAKTAAMHFFQSIQQEFKPSQYQITNLYPSDIATREANPDIIDPKDLAIFVRELAESPRSYVLTDVTIYPKGS